MRLAAGVEVGPYRIRCFLGAGGMGEVYSAQDRKLHREVALKVLPERFASRPDRVQRFEREARVLATLSHPNIAAIYDFHDGRDVKALVLELVDGPTLADRLDAGPLPLDESLAIAGQVARALEAAHDRGIVHRDLKPANVKVLSDGTVKLLDFSLAKAVDPLLRGQGLEQSTLTDGGDLALGTPAYMAPEQARGLPVDRRADVWAFGCVLFEMLTGKHPFRPHHEPEATAEMQSSDPDWRLLPPAVSPAVQVVLDGCLQIDPKRRLRDMADVRLALEGSLGRREPGEGRPPTTTSLARRAALLAVVAVAALIGIQAGELIGGRSHPRPVVFFLTAPDGETFGRAITAPAPALSPDGAHLAFIAPLDSTRVIWIQTLGETRARPLRGSEDPGLPFWSPDGRSIGFASADRLRTIAVSGGGAPREVCVCGPRYGGAWGPDGTIVFATRAGLARVPAEGGAVTPLTRVDTSRLEASHESPVFLPGSSRFLYLIRSARPERRGIYLASLEDPVSARRVLPDDSNVAYGVDADGHGHLFFVRNRTLLTQRFDAGRGAVVGEPAVVTRPIVPGEGIRYAAFTAGGRSLVYRRWIAPQDRLLWLDRRGRRLKILGPEGLDYDYVGLAPDGARAAVAMRDWDTGRRDLWLVDTETAVSDRFTSTSPEAGFPIWTPNGARIIYASTQGGTWDLHWRPVDGRAEERPVFDGRPPRPVPNYPRDVSPDGRFLLFGGDDLWLSPLDDRGAARKLLSAFHGRVSPNGRWLAYTSTEAGQRQVYVTSFPQPSQRWRISVDGGQDPQWRRDGRELYYVATDRSFVAVPVSTGRTFAAGEPDILFRSTFDPQSLSFGSAYAPAPDGQRFLVIEHMKNDDPVLVVHLDWADFDTAPQDLGR